jgi:hypothetical protein
VWWITFSLPALLTTCMDLDGMQSLILFSNLYFLQWALNILKKPIVTIQWLHQCWNEHRVVPQESFRVFPFSGLTICVTRIPAGCDISYLFLLFILEYLFLWC